jgi:hypothetical protein
MSTDLRPEPERWSERGGGATVEDGVGAAFRRLKRATEPSDLDVARWVNRAMVGRPQKSHRLTWSIAIAALVLGGGGLVMASRAVWKAMVRGSTASSAGDTTPLPPARRVRVAAPPATVPSTPDVEEVSIRRDGPVLPPARRVGAAARSSTGSTAPRAFSAEPSPDEAQLLARAFRELRGAGDASAALTTLDERDRRFPSGGLGTEAALARVEALMALGRSDEALPILLRIRDPRGGLTREVRIARGELLARSGRCAEAVEDFDDLLATALMDAPRERARYGRASCRLSAAGQTAGAIADLEGYLAEYPDGRFASAVRATLETLRRP